MDLCRTILWYVLLFNFLFSVALTYLKRKDQETHLMQPFLCTIYWRTTHWLSGRVFCAAFGKPQRILFEETMTDGIAAQRVSTTQEWAQLPLCFSLQKHKRGNEVLQSTSSRLMSSRVGSINEADGKNNRKSEIILCFKPLHITFDKYQICIRYATGKLQYYSLENLQWYICSKLVLI